MEPLKVPRFIFYVGIITPQFPSKLSDFLQKKFGIRASEAGSYD